VVATIQQINVELPREVRDDCFDHHDDEGGTSWRKGSRRGVLDNGG
jgi:hypothetical protein